MVLRCDSLLDLLAISFRGFQSERFDIVAIVMFTRGKRMQGFGKSSKTLAVVNWSIGMGEDKGKVAIESRACQSMKMLRNALKSSEIFPLDLSGLSISAILGWGQMLTFFTISFCVSRGRSTKLSFILES